MGKVGGGETETLGEADRKTRETPGSRIRLREVCDVAALNKTRSCRSGGRGETKRRLNMEPRLLILETSSAAGVVALACGSQVLGTRRLDEQRRHARDLVPAVGDLLSAQGWQPRDLSGVIVSRGPGSYTGLRVGIMSAKTLAYATGCRLLAIDTFAAIAWQAPTDVRLLDVLADAQQDKIYVQRFERQSSDNAPIAVTPLAIQTIAEWQATLPASAWITGPGVRKLQARFPDVANVVEMSQWDPRPESLLRLGLTRWARGEGDDLWTLEPLYLRPSAAEEKWAERHQTACGLAVSANAKPQAADE
jgi:tRNA threonylcarbamoyladenosine biosynthesis protein TsaB